MADLFSVCEIEGKVNWNKDQVKERYKIMRKNRNFNKDYWDEYYRNKFYLHKDINEKTGLLELVSLNRATDKKSVV